MGERSSVSGAILYGVPTTVFAIELACRLRATVTYRYKYRYKYRYNTMATRL